MTDLRSRRAYLAVQGTSVFVWWAVIGAFPLARELFVPLAASHAFLYAFLPPDCVVLAAGSLATSYIWRQGSPPPTLWIVAGALWYTTAYVIGLWSVGELPVVGPLLMALASLGTAWVARVSDPARGEAV